jgi:hypothetical protein
MADRLRVLLIFAVILAAGAFLGSAWVQWSPPGERAVETEDGRTVRIPGRVRVEVLNAGGKADMARRATDRLRDHGLDVVYFGNAETFGRDSSVVLDRVGRLEAARAVADVLGIRHVRSEPDSNLYLDVTVLLGREWEPASGQVRETGPRDEPWWDLRRYFEERAPARSADPVPDTL